MLKLVVVSLVSLAVLGSPPPETEVKPAHIIRPPIRCPEGYKPDAKGRCRRVYKRAAGLCLDGEEPDEWGLCEEALQNPEDVMCPEGEDCLNEGRRPKREAEEKPKKRSKKTKSRRSRSEDGEKARSKHLILLLKKKKELLKPKPPQHHPHPEEPAEPEDGPQTFAPEEVPTEPPQTLFFGDEACVDNQTGPCHADPEEVETVHATKEFKEWQPPKSSESSSSESSSSESQPGSGETEEEILERAVRIKLDKILRMKQRYGPALRRWVVERLKEYEDSLNE